MRSKTWATSVLSSKPAPTVAPVIPEFASESGGLINPSNLRQRSFVPLLKRAGLPQITFHDLRHTCASLLFQRNVHPKFVQELLGHASAAITLDTYSHMLPGMGGEAADAIGDALGLISHRLV